MAGGYVWRVEVVKRLLCFMVDDEDTDMPVIAQINAAYSNSEEFDLRERIMGLPRYTTESGSTEARAWVPLAELMALLEES